MLVTHSSFEQVLEELKKAPKISLDTETTGLFPYRGDRLFSIICANANDTFYFNFNRYDGMDERFTLPRTILARGFSSLLDGKKLVFLANAKFDMHMLHVEGVKMNIIPWDVLAIAKTIDNSHFQYGLDKVAERAGYEKLSTVEEYISKHDLYDRLKVEGKKSEIKNPRYDRVPLEVIQPYGERDARITYEIGESQIREVDLIDKECKEKGHPSFGKCVAQELKTTIVCFEIEKRGMRIDGDFIRRGIAHETSRASDAERLFSESSGRPFVDSNKALGEAFLPLNIQGGRTKKGNASFDKKSLSQIKHPLAKLVTEYRDATKRANSYYKSFLSFATEDGVVHPNIKQTGARTFRFSVTQPALQTLEKPDEDLEIPLETEMRNSFIARDGAFLVAIDYKQQEYRLSADYSGETELIKKIMEGEDVHTATAHLMGVPRKAAKTLNFLLLYGGGVAKLCMALMKPIGTEAQLKALVLKYVYKMTLHPSKDSDAIMTLETCPQNVIDHDVPLLNEAYVLQKKYFSSLPKTKRFIDNVKDEVKAKGYVYNFAGRRLRLEPRFAYKGANHLIQSSGAEIMRLALIELHQFLDPFDTKILLSVHDEILFETPESEFYLIPKIQAIMANVYKPLNGCFMDTDAKFGKAWGSMKKYGSKKIQC